MSLSAISGAGRETFSVDRLGAELNAQAENLLQMW